jgi:Flp pilus assembly protein TadG
MERMIERHRRRGLAAVEMALLLPLLLLLLLGLIEYGWVFFALHVTSSAAREGCRVAVTQSATSAQVQTTIQSRMASGGFNSFTAVYPNPSGHPAGSDYAVEITLAYQSITSFPLIPVPGQLFSRVVMRKEGPLFSNP